MITNKVLKNFRIFEEKFFSKTDQFSFLDKFFFWKNKFFNLCDGS